MGLINELLDWFIRIKAAKRVEVFADEFGEQVRDRECQKTKSRPESRRHGRAQKFVHLLLLAA